jgi:hypothetical protein
LLISRSAARRCWQQPVGGDKRAERIVPGGGEEMRRDQGDDHIEDGGPDN